MWPQSIGILEFQRDEVGIKSGLGIFIQVQLLARLNSGTGKLDLSGGLPFLNNEGASNNVNLELPASQRTTKRWLLMPCLDKIIKKKSKR